MTHPTPGDSKDQAHDDTKWLLAEHLSESYVSPGSGLRIRCPHCFSSVEVVVDSQIRDITCSSCGSHFSLAGDTEETGPQTLKRIGHFELVERIGMGSFGTVWKASDTELDRTVAIKIPRKGRLDAADTEKFLREARAAAQLKHANIVSVHEVGRDQDTVYIVSDFVPGVALSEWMVTRRFSLREAAQFCSEMAEALHHAHEEGVVHRDLKPANVMIDAHQKPHIMDFGLAKREAGEVTMTMEGQVLGTPAYMSPEQAQGEGHLSDRRSDVYSLGVMLFQLITGELPFRGSSAMLVFQVIHEEPPSPRKLHAGIPRDLETICLKCLEKSRAQRYATAEALADDLRHFVADEPIAARPIGPVARLWRWCKRNPMTATVAGLILFLAVAAPIVTVRESKLRADAEREAEATKKAQSGRKKSEEVAIAFLVEEDRRSRANAGDGEPSRASSNDLAVISSPTGPLQTQHDLYVAHMRWIQEAWDSGRLDRVLELLQRHRPQPGQVDLRGFEWYYWWGLARRHHRDLIHQGSIHALAYLPDNNSIASVSLDGSVQLWDVQRGTTLASHTTEPAIFQSFSPDGRTLASSFGNKVMNLWDISTGQLTAALELQGRAVGSTVFSSEGQFLACRTHDPAIEVWDVEAEQRKTILQVVQVALLALSPEGKMVATIGSERTCQLWNVDTGQREATIGTSPVVAAAFSPDNSVLVLAGEDHHVRLWDLDSNQMKWHAAAHAGRILATVFSPDGTKVASASQDRIVRLWDVVSGQLVSTLKGHADRVVSVAFSSDGEFLASTSKNIVRVWRIKDRTSPRTIAEHSGIVSALAFSPDGALVASAGPPATSEDGVTTEDEVVLRDVATLQPRIRLNGHASRVHALEFSQDGTTLTAAGGDGMVTLWAVAEGEIVSTLKGHDGPVGSVALSPQGNLLAAANSDHSVSLWDVIRGEVTLTCEPHPSEVTSVVFSPDGERIVSGSRDGTVMVCHVGTGQTVQTLKGHEGSVTSIAISPNGAQVVAANDDSTIFLWNLRHPGQPTTRLSQNSAVVHSVIFLPGGQSIASARGDGIVQLWNLATGQATLRLEGHDGPVQSLACSPNGSILASGGGDGRIQLWHAATDVDTDPNGQPGVE